MQAGNFVATVVGNIGNLNERTVIYFKLYLTF